MSHYTLCSIAQIDSEDTYKKFEKLCESNQDHMVDFLTEKLSKPLSKFDINNDSSKDGKFDLWTIFHVTTADELLKNLPELDRMPNSILLPNLEWIESKEAFYFVSEQNQEEYDTWINEFKKVLSSYKDSLVALIDWHI